MLVYRLKNIWQRGGWHGADPCNNPGPPLIPGGHSNGLGLVERCGVNGSGAYATPKTLAFYHALLGKMRSLKSDDGEVPPRPANRASCCAARTPNAAGPSRVTLSLR